VHRVLAELLLNDSLLDIATRSAVYFQLIEVVDAASRVDCNMLFRFATRSVADHSPHHDRALVAGGLTAVCASVRTGRGAGPSRCTSLFGAAVAAAALLQRIVRPRQSKVLQRAAPCCDVLGCLLHAAWCRGIALTHGVGRWAAVRPQSLSDQPHGRA
jgi:hypothetical protein